MTTANNGRIALHNSHTMSKRFTITARSLSVPKILEVQIRSERMNEIAVEPTVSFWDAGEYILTSSKLQVGHPP